MPWTYTPGPEFFAAVRAIAGGDTQAVVDAVRQTPALRQDVERIEGDILAGRRTIRLPLEPAPGTLEPGAHMVETLKLVADLRLNDDDTRKAVAGRRMVVAMALVGERMAAKRDANARATRRS